MEQLRFGYQAYSDLCAHIRELGLDLPQSEDVGILGDVVPIKHKEAPNRFVIQPMEGCDSLPDGSPSELTLRRYGRYGAGGAGLIWYEAVAVAPKHRGKQNQLCLHTRNGDAFSHLVAMTRQAAQECHGHQPYLVLQLTHPGRFGDNKDILFHDQVMDRAGRIDPSQAVLADSELSLLVDSYVAAARLAMAAGFDSVDVKACHRYLLSESLAARTRVGDYGGDYENRTRLLRTIVAAIKQSVDIDVAVRLNAFDGIPTPYGFGADEQGEIDLAEPVRLVGELYELGVDLINVSAATPYLLPHITRPYDHPTSKGYPQPEHPLIGVCRLLHLARGIQTAVPRCVVVSSGYSWLRQWAPPVAAGVVKQGWAQMVGFGRAAFAYPDMAADILRHSVDRRRVCVACSKCSELKANAVTVGCVVRDAQVYLAPYRTLMART